MIANQQARQISAVRTRVASSLAALWLGGCATEQPAAPAAEPVGPPMTLSFMAEGMRGPLADATCDAPESPCDEGDERVFCSATTPRAAGQAAATALQAWGRSACEGLQKLTKAACARKVAPASLQAVQCVPDASHGHCPPEPQICTQEMAPAVCVAKQYDGQDLVAAQRPHAWGHNRCQAEYALRLAACQANLDPTVLGKIQCQADTTAGECPPKDTDCAPAGPRAQCSGRLEQEAEILRASGESECAARQRLARLACQYDARPSGLKDVSCRARDSAEK